MSLVDVLPAATPMEGILSHRPELLGKFRTFYQSFWRDELVPRRTLELCRLRIAYIHGCDAELAISDPQMELDDTSRDALRSGDIDGFPAHEQVALALAEVMPFTPHQVGDDLVAAAKDQLGNAGCVSLLTALAFFDVSCRLKIVLDLPVVNAQRDSETLA
jgi:alkylhydroperoxidase family enzyme